MEASTSKLEQFPVHLFNTFTRKKELFTPINPGRVGMYVCGPTVYGDPHLGHARAAITFDVVFRYFQFMGLKVRYVRNITDVGHLEDEVAEEGEDKILKKARLEQIEPMEVVQTYTNSYHYSLDQLNVKRPSIEPRASGHIIEQIDFIQKIMENGLAYEVNGSVYFDLEKYRHVQNYGQLSGKVLDDLVSGSRDTEGLDEKRSPLDFALWKNAKPSHIMRWPSPWGDGFPGWHIECSAMSTKYLGAPFDIHGGGMDLQFPHHECEIAQATAAFNDDPDNPSQQTHFCNYWIHNNMVTLDKVKMAKSKGNFITLADLFAGNHELLEQAYSPMTVRFFILQAHYGSVVDFSNKALQAAEKAYKRLMQAMELLGSISHEGSDKPDEATENMVQEQIDACYASMSDDFNTATTIAALFKMAEFINKFYHKQLALDLISKATFEEMVYTFTSFITEVLGLKAEAQGNDGRVSDLVSLLIELRKTARENKDYATSDQIRDQLGAMGIQLKDEKGGGTTFSLT